jgi:hypothetical protein
MFIAAPCVGGRCSWPKPRVSLCAHAWSAGGDAPDAPPLPAVLSLLLAATTSAAQVDALNPLRAWIVVAKVSCRGNARSLCPTGHDVVAG